MNYQIQESFLKGDTESASIWRIGDSVLLYNKAEFEVCSIVHNEEGKHVQYFGWLVKKEQKTFRVFNQVELNKMRAYQ